MPPLIIYPNGAKISGRDKSLPYRAAQKMQGRHFCLPWKIMDVKSRMP